MDNKQYYKDNAKRTKRRMATWFTNLKKTLKCEQCGEDHPACIDFHHRDPDTKLMTVSNMMCRCDYGKERILAEIEKCDVLCANCHRKLHY